MLCACVGVWATQCASADGCGGELWNPGGFLAVSCSCPLTVSLSVAISPLVSASARISAEMAASVHVLTSSLPSVNTSHSDYTVIDDAFSTPRQIKPVAQSVVASDAAHSPPYAEDSPRYHVSAACVEFLSNLGVHRQHGGLSPDVKARSSPYIVLDDGFDLYSGKLFAQIILSARAWLPIALHVTELDVLRRCVRGDGVSSAKAWSILVPVLDNTFDLYISDDLLYSLQTCSADKPVPADTQAAMLGLLEDLCVNGAELISFPVVSATPQVPDYYDRDAFPSRCDTRGYDGLSVFDEVGEGGEALDIDRDSGGLNDRCVCVSGHWSVW